MGCFVTPCPLVLLIFGFKHTRFVPKLPASVATSVLLGKLNNRWTCNKKTETKKEKNKRKKKVKEMWNKQQTQAQREPLQGKFPYRRAQMACQNLISISTFIKELYNSIVQVPDPISKGCLVQERNDGHSASTRTQSR